MNRSYHILIADDDPTVLLLMRAALEQAGYQVLLARDGLEALAKFDASVVDLVMLDVAMPEMNGMQVCAQLRAKAGPSLPIVMVTGLNDMDSVDAAFKAGATDFIVKPIHWPLIPHRVGFQLRAAQTLAELAQAKKHSDHVRAELTSTLAAIPDLLFEVDAQGRYLSVHAHRSDLLWASPAAVIGKCVTEVLPADAACVCMAALTQAQAHGFSRGMQYPLKLGESLRWFELSVARKSDEDPQNSDFIAIARDVTQMKEQQNQLEHIAHYDTLTGLPNRVLLVDRLRQAMQLMQQRSSQLAVAYLDLDDFKTVNDRYGHEVGDQLLLVLADRMKSSLRGADLLARIGGDEFVLVLSDLADAPACKSILQQLLRSVAGPVRLHGFDIQVSASMGVTLYPQDDAEPELLIRHADQAMFQAKQDGKKRLELFDVAHEAVIKTMNESIENFRLALSRGEFVLYFQPKVDLNMGRVLGVEALVRWNHPERGLLSPGTFLPLFEDHLFSVEFGEWVIRAALDQVQTWRLQGLNLPVSVNIGGMSLQQDDFVTRLAQMVNSHPGFPSGSLQLELLETTALKDLPRVSEVMNACREIGVEFALDDFGTGYSSLAYLKHLPVNTLKIDQSFVLQILHDASDLAIVEGVISLARTMGRVVIAEGVETQAHGELLLKMGCPLVQGYGIARPMPAHALPDWVARWEKQPVWLA